MGDPYWLDVPIVKKGGGWACFREIEKEVIRSTRERRGGRLQAHDKAKIRSATFKVIQNILNGAYRNGSFFHSIKSN